MGNLAELQDYKPASSPGIGFFLQLNPSHPGSFPVLDSLTPLGQADLADLPSPALLFAEIDPAAAGRMVPALRAKIHEDVYLVAVTESPLSSAWIARLIELGADDVADSSDASMSLVQARALRQLERRKSLLLENHAVNLEHTFLQASIDTLPSPIFFKNRQGQYTGFNKAFLDMIGKASDEVIGKTALDLFPNCLAATYHAADQDLMARGGTQIYEAQVHLANGETRDACFNKAVILDSTGAARGLAGTLIDISDRKAYELMLTEAAERDHLTHCWNRRKFFQFAEKVEAQAVNDNLAVCVAVLDIDHFKLINDQYGHAAGDAVLRTTANHLMMIFEEPDCVARAGGEEFYAIFCGTTLVEAKAKAESLCEAIANIKTDVGDSDITVTVSIGVARLAAGDGTVAHAISRADRALYTAKRKGRNRVISAD